MNNTDASWPLHRAVIKQLKGDTALKALVGEKLIIRDQDQATVSYPHIKIGDSFTNAWQSATFDGQEHEFSLHLWSREGGSEKSKEIASAVINLLHNADFPIPGHALVDLQFESAETRYRKDKGAYHCLIRFKGLTVSD